MAAVDVEDESILASIFKDSFPDSWRDVPDFTAYLSELSGFGVDQLGREPERLAEERAQILQQTRELAFSNYQTFIRTADCTEHIYRDFGRVESSVSRLLDKLPGFGERCRGFMKEAEEIAVSRRMNSLTLNRHTEILEILEIPQLMDTCVRNGYYEEALELAAYVKRLGEEALCTAGHPGWTCSRRRSCGVKFLQARGLAESILNAIPEDDPYFHVTKTIEACRVHLFDIITQYRAIFSDEDPLVPPAGGQVAVNEAAIFHGWVVQKVAEFLETLERDLQRGVGGRLDSLLGQCMYFGLSFSRGGRTPRTAGADVPAGGGGDVPRRRAGGGGQVPGGHEPVHAHRPALGAGRHHPPVAPSTQPGTLQPPMALLDFQPLACFLNNILTAFNDLRLCCPVGLAQDVTRCLEDGLKKVSLRISAGDPSDSGLPPGGGVGLQRQREGAFCSVLLYADDLLPFLNRCLQVLFPPAQLALILGVPPTQLHRYGSLGCIELPAVSSLSTSCFLRETLAPPPSMPELDLTAELSSGTFQTQPKEPATDPDLTVETGSPDPALTWSGLRERESEPTEPKLRNSTKSFLWSDAKTETMSCVHTEGSNVRTEGSSVHTEGSNVRTEGSDVHAEGSDIHTEGSDVHTEGSSVHTEGSNVRTEGSDVHAEGSDVRTEGSSVHTEGSDVRTEGSDVHTEGSDIHTEGSDIHTEGSDVHTEGSDIHAEGSDVHAEGSDVRTEGSDVHAEGSDVHTEGSSVHTEGSDVRAEGSDVRAEGSDVRAEGSDVRAEGSNVCTEGSDFRTEGFDVRAEGSDHRHIYIDAALSAESYVNGAAILVRADLPVN
ncbi:Conserved oligomeric Golgi complex subunit 8 [Larimichthys crocea]|uniref:Conserved oligomeric Golgi complex subunit 8 n=1 Tax=Larimichthys crocea TaxID=215358 RepID=A0A6G0J2U2_LARCR|nr:Conserved oligomeric Golgi complex subunit 8 [Larimichthys crocea]